MCCVDRCTGRGPKCLEGREKERKQDGRGGEAVVLVCVVYCVSVVCGIWWVGGRGWVCAFCALML